MAMGGMTLRPAAARGLRAGVDDELQHAPGDRPGVALCGARVKPDARWDRPDWTKCAPCQALRVGR